MSRTDDTARWHEAGRGRRAASRTWSRRGRWARQAALIAAGGGLLALGTIRAVRAVERRLGQQDFAHYYVSGRLLLEGESPYRELPYDRFGLAPDPGLEGRRRGGTNPPPLVLLSAPFALLGPQAGQWVWNALRACGLVWLLFVTSRLVGVRTTSPAYLLFAGLVVAADSIWWGFYFSQVQVLLAALAVTAGWLSIRGRHTGALLAGTAAALLKLYPATLLPWLVWRARHHRKALLAASALAAIVLTVTWPLWPGFFGRGMEVIRSQAVNQTLNISAHSLILNLGWLASGALDPGVAWRVAAVVVSALVLAAAYALPVRSSAHRLALLLVATIAASIAAWLHYLVLAVPAFAIAAADTWRRPSQGRLAALAACWALGIHAMNGSGIDAQPAVRMALNYLPLAGLAGLGCWMTIGISPDNEDGDPMEKSEPRLHR